MRADMHSLWLNVLVQACLDRRVAQHIMLASSSAIDSFEGSLLQPTHMSADMRDDGAQPDPQGNPTSLEPMSAVGKRSDPVPEPLIKQIGSRLIADGDSSDDPDAGPMRQEPLALARPCMKPRRRKRDYVFIDSDSDPDGAAEQREKFRKELSIDPPYWMDHNLAAAWCRAVTRRLEAGDIIDTDLEWSDAAPAAQVVVPQAPPNASPLRPTPGQPVGLTPAKVYRRVACKLDKKSKDVKRVFEEVMRCFFEEYEDTGKVSIGGFMKVDRRYMAAEDAHTKQWKKIVGQNLQPSTKVRRKCGRYVNNVIFRKKARTIAPRLQRTIQE